VSTAQGGGPRNGGPGSGAHGDGGPGPHDPGSFDPSLGPLIQALTASGHPHERTGRDAALAAFRAANQQAPHQSAAGGARQSDPYAHSLSHPGGPRRPRRPLHRLPARLAAVGAAGFAVLVGVTAAAYAQALPAPVQRVAHSVLSPLGVPNSKPDSYAPSAMASGTGSIAVAPSGNGSSRPGSSGSALPGTSSSAASSSGSSPTSPGVSGSPSSGSASSSAGPSATASPISTASVSVTTSPSPGGSASPTAPGAGPYVITLSAARARVPFGAADLFTAQLLTTDGSPAAHVRVRLLERAVGSVGWQVVAAGFTGERGRAALSDPSLTENTMFRLAVAGGTHSAALRVTVVAIRLSLITGKVNDRLIVTAPGGSPGDLVYLEQLTAGAWETLTSKPLGPKLHATFVLPAGTAGGYLYRTELTGTAAAVPPLSNRVWVPRLPGTGATGVQPSGSPTPAPTPTPTPTATAITTPGSSGDSPATGSPGASASPVQ
jgi:hypothetical protein